VLHGGRPGRGRANPIRSSAGAVQVRRVGPAAAAGEGEVPDRRAGATLKVDDNEAGKTPVTVALGPGPHVIQVIAPDGRSTEQQIDVKPGRKLDLLIPLPSRAGGPATLGVASDPSGARVFLAGAVAGVPPYSIEP